MKSWHETISQIMIWQRGWNLWIRDEEFEWERVPEAQDLYQKKNHRGGSRGVSPCSEKLSCWLNIGFLGSKQIHNLVALDHSNTIACDFG